MFDVAPAFQKPRRKTARSRKPTPIHFKSSLTCWMSSSSAFEHCRLLKKFSAFSFHFASDDFGFHTRWMISRKPRAQKKCVKLLSLLLLGALARFRDHLPLHHWGNQENEPKYSILRRIPDLYPQFHGAFGSFTFSVQTVDCPVVNLSAWLCRTVTGRRRTWCPKAFVALMSTQLMILAVCWLKLFFHLTSCRFHSWGRTATAIFFPASCTLSSREFWCPASFVELLWSCLLDEAINISLQGSRSIVSFTSCPDMLLKQSVLLLKWLGFRWW